MWALLSNFNALWRKPYSIYTCKFWNFPTCFWWPQGKCSSLCPDKIGKTKKNEKQHFSEASNLLSLCAGFSLLEGEGVMRGIPPPTSWKIGHSLHLEKYPPHIIIFMLQPNKNFIFRCSHCSCTTFILTSYSLCSQVILILNFVNVQYLENVIF